MADEGTAWGTVAYLQLLGSEADAYETSVRAPERPRPDDAGTGGPLWLDPYPRDTLPWELRLQRDRWYSHLDEARQLAEAAAEAGRRLTPAEQGRLDVLLEWLHRDGDGRGEVPEPPDELIRQLRGWRSAVWHDAVYRAERAAEENRRFDTDEQDRQEALAGELAMADARITAALLMLRRAREADEAYAALGDHVPEVCKRLRDRRAACWDECQRIAVSAAGENRGLTDYEAGCWEALTEELCMLDARIRGALDTARRGKEADEAYAALTGSRQRRTGGSDG